MSSQESMNGESTPESGATKDMFEPKPKPKVIRVLTVLAYVLSVSMAAILLSIYYIFMWEGHPHIGAFTSVNLSEHVSDIESSGSAKLARYTHNEQPPPPPPHNAILKDNDELISTTIEYNDISPTDATEKQEQITTLENEQSNISLPTITTTTSTTTTTEELTAWTDNGGDVEEYQRKSVLLGKLVKYYKYPYDEND